MWDTSYFSTLWTMLDPRGVELLLQQFLAQCTARPARGNFSGLCTSSRQFDFTTGQPSGGWYGFNWISMYLLIQNFLRVTGGGPQTLLGPAPAARPAVEWLDAIATAWNASSKVDVADGLADYGVAGNLLECIATYQHRVAALNGAAVWMMRDVARLHGQAGNTTRAEALNRSATALEAATLQLYVPGAGFWTAQFPNGTAVQVRTVIDFMTLVNTGLDHEKLPLAEMARFAETELLTPGWMRALSLRDAAAGHEGQGRTDHGSGGAWDGWPALTSSAFGRLGRWDVAIDMVRKSSYVLREGPFGQAHRVYGNGSGTAAEMPHTPLKSQHYLAACGAIHAVRVPLSAKRHRFAPNSGPKYAAWTVLAPLWRRF